MQHPIANTVRIFAVVLVAIAGQVACSPPNTSQPQIISSDSLKFDNELVDTIEIWDSLAGNPFLFDYFQIPLDSLLAFLPSDVQLEKTLEPSLYYEGQKDSSTVIICGESKIYHVKNPSVSYISTAIVKDKEILMARNIRVGDTYESICTKLNLSNHPETQYDKIYINWGDGTNTLLFNFENGKLYEAVFCPYLG